MSAACVTLVGVRFFRPRSRHFQRSHGLTDAVNEPNENKEAGVCELLSVCAPREEDLVRT